MSPMRSGRNTHGRGRARLAERACTPGAAGAEGAGGMEGLAAVPVGGGGAWLGFEATRRAKLAARTARGRAAAHGHNQQPGPTTHHAAPGTPVGTNTSPTHRTSNGHMKPVTPLQAVIIRNLKPQTPLLAGEAMKTAVSTGGRVTGFNQDSG